MYTLPELLNVREAGTSSVRPADFDLEAFWTAWCAEGVARHDVFRARVRVAPEALQWLPRYLGSGAREALPAEALPEDAGWVAVDLSFESLEAACSRLLALGGAVQVLPPDALRLSVADFGARIAAVYGRSEG